MTKNILTRTDADVYTRWRRVTKCMLDLYRAYRDGRITTQEYQTMSGLVGQDPSEVRFLIALADTYNSLKKGD